MKLNAFIKESCENQGLLKPSSLSQNTLFLNTFVFETFFFKKHRQIFEEIKQFLDYKEVFLK